MHKTANPIEHINVRNSGRPGGGAGDCGAPAATGVPEGQAGRDPAGGPGNPADLRSTLPSSEVNYHNIFCIFFFHAVVHGDKIWTSFD